ncbi:uncharacterized protein ARMOST_16109 [Armillaria ostoyae]|uniref:Uncharacterized protein n=1 Tax=Armillaria ostoyae TaxID=47428 RepID=A0A284RV87_ARMOS|nr:uncharacterized protein ARMOST_16109 [Armillaria ostoyae]
MHLFQTYSPFSFDSSKGGATAAKFFDKKQDKKPRENMTSRSIFFTKLKWLPGAYSQICGAVQVFNVFRDERTSYCALVLTKAFAPPTEAVSMSDHRHVELVRLQKVEEDIARRYGRLSGSYVDPVDLFQAVKDRAFKIKDEKSLSDLRELDRLLKLRLELKTGAPPSFPSYRFHPSRVWSFLCDLSARCGVQYLFRNTTKLPE